MPLLLAAAWGALQLTLVVGYGSSDRRLGERRLGPQLAIAQGHGK